MSTRATRRKTARSIERSRQREYARDVTKFEAWEPTVRGVSQRGTVASIGSASPDVADKTISGLLGHSQVSTTQDTYATAVAPAVRRAGEVVGDAVLAGLRERRTVQSSAESSAETG